MGSRWQNDITLFWVGTTQTLADSSYRPKYDGFLNMIEETGPNMEMDIIEANTDIDYGNIGKSWLNPTRNGGEGSF